MANVRTLVRHEAQHIRVVSLAEGDVYKRIIPADTYNKAKVVFGAVKDVLVNGEHTAIVSVEYEISSYSDVEAKLVTLTEQEDVALFPARPEEVRVYFEEVREAQDRKVAAKRRELAEALRRFDAVNSVLAGELTVPQIEQVAITS
jgi:hypothetical protein